MSEVALPLEDAVRGERAPRRLSLSAKLSLGWEIVKGGLVELWAHKLRSTLTLTLLMLGVFALVVMSSVLDGVMDKIAMGFSGMSWDGTIMLAPDSHETTEEQKRFAMSPGLRFEDLPRLTAPDQRVLAYVPRATKGNEWLLLKHGKAMKPISSKQDDTSAVSKRSMAQIAGPHSRKWTSGRKAANPPSGGSPFKSRVASLAKKSSRKK